MENAGGFARQHGISAPFYKHTEMLAEIRPDIDNIACVNYVHGRYDVRINPNSGNELFLPDAVYSGDPVLREKLPTAQGTSFPMPLRFHAHGYVNEMDDSVECLINKDRFPVVRRSYGLR